MPISFRTSLLSLGCHLAQPLLYRLKSTLSNAVNVFGECIECENSTDSENCECDTTSCVSFFYCCYNIPLHHNFTCIRGFRVCLIQLLVFSHQCIHIKVSEQIQTNTCHQDLLAYLSVRRQPTYTIQRMGFTVWYSFWRINTLAHYDKYWSDTRSNNIYKYCFSYVS